LLAPGPEYTGPNWFAWTVKTQTYSTGIVALPDNNRHIKYIFKKQTKCVQFLYSSVAQ